MENNEIGAFFPPGIVKKKKKKLSIAKREKFCLPTKKKMAVSFLIISKPDCTRRAVKDVVKEGIVIKEC